MLFIGTADDEEHSVGTNPIEFRAGIGFIAQSIEEKLRNIIANIIVATSSYAFSLAQGTRLFLPSNGDNIPINIAMSITAIATTTTIGNQKVYGEDNMLFNEQTAEKRNPGKFPTEAFIIYNLMVYLERESS
jgi:hypothetical protein